MPDDFDIIIIGGGASGMMAAGIAAKEGKRVLMLEKNGALGEKLKITGGGRCNITNAEEDEHLFLSHFGAAKDFLHSPFSKFGVKQTFEFFEGLGLPLITQARKRVFPQSENASNVVRVLEEFMRKGGVRVQTNTGVDKIVVEGGRIAAVIAGGKRFVANSYILATGGKSHPETGSTGDGFEWLKMLGHKVSEPTPTLVPLAVEDEWVKALAGITLNSVRIIFFLDGNRKFVVNGDLLCTHFGLSGPMVLNAAAKVADLMYEGVVTAEIDLFPAEDLGALDERMVSVFDKNKNKDLKNIFNDIGPLGVGHAILPLFGLDPSMKVHSITKEQRKNIVRIIKSLPVSIKGLMGYDRAIVADGGLSLEEIDTKTMRSKKYPNLYVTGDLLHISRPSGGYSLQLCWTTGYVAGISAASQL